MSVQNVVLLSEPGSELTSALEGRFAEAGVRVVVAGPDARLERATREADAIIDCCVVDAARKRAQIEAYDRWLRRGRPLISCCHAASATEIAAQAKQPGRLVGFALVPPWEARETVECAMALQTDPAIKASVEAVWRAVGLDCVWIEDSTAMVMPRTVACLANEAFFALMEGTASAEDIDRAMRLGTRYPLGPLAWAERLGLDQVLAIMEALGRAHGDDRYRPAPNLRALVLAGRRSVHQAGGSAS